MAEERVERKLTAILAADVAGYSRLMGENETLNGALVHERPNMTETPFVRFGRISQMRVTRTARPVAAEQRGADGCEFGRL